MNISDKLIYHWHYSKLNVFKTILINFKTLPFNQAIKFPIFIYGNLDAYYLLGSIEFKDCDVRKGMIKLGANKEFLSTVKGASLIILSSGSKLIFEGPCEISSNFLLRLGENAELHFGSKVFLGSNVKTVCIKKISVGEGTRIGFESQLIDSDFHFVYNTDKKILNHREKEIIIGRYNWIGNRTSINKGCKTPEYSIIASSSILNRNYCNSESLMPFIGGAPAKIINNKLRRIFSLDIENEIIKYLREDGRIENLPKEIIRRIELELN